MDANCFGKCKASELRAEIRQARKKAKPQARIRIILKKVISNIILNKIELASLMNDIVYLLTYNDYEINRLCSDFIVHYAVYNPDDARNALDFYVRFSKDKDPLLRALAIKTVSSVDLKDFFRLAMDIVTPLLNDENPHVKTAAAFAVARLFHENQRRVMEAGLVEELNNLLYDENTNVVSNALAALDSITKTSASHTLNVNKEHLLLLLEGIGSASEWKQVYLLDALMSYVPQNSEDAIQMMEVILPSLLHENTSVVLNTIKLVVYLSNFIDTPEITIPNLGKRVGAALASLLYKPAEIQFLVLRNVILVLLGKGYLIEVDVGQFFWNFDDPMYIKDTKLEIIYLLANEDNIEVVFRELEEYATDVDEKMARKAIRAFGNLSVKLERAASRCVALLADLLSFEHEHIAQEAVVVLSNILRKYENSYEEFIEPILRRYECLVDVDAKIALAWIVGQFPSKVEHIDKIFQFMCGSFENESLSVQNAIMTAVVKYYVAYPTRGDSIVLQVLKFATENSGNPDLRERGFFYWRMISHEMNGSSSETFQKYTKEIVVDHKCQITPDNENIDPANLEELELNIGSLASIYLKSVRTVFRLAKKKALPASPALQKRRSPPLLNGQSTAKATNATKDDSVRENYRETLFSNAGHNRSNLSFASELTQISSEKSNKEGFRNKLVRRASSMISKKAL